MRSSLDHLLVREAQRAGALLEEGCAVQRVRTSAHGVEIETARGPFQAQFVVAADGANSLVARQSGWSETPRFIPALECEVFVREEDFTRLAGAVRFDFEVLPEGYAWVFPKREHLSIGVLSMRRGQVNLPESLDRYLRLLGIQNPDKIERHGYVIPIKPRADGIARERVLLVGDAAGIADPVTAEGITHAIQTGQLAAQAILQGRFEANAAAAQYQSSVEKSIVPELNPARALAWVLYRHSRLAGWLFRRQGKALCELMTDVVMGKRTYHGLLRSASSYNKLLSGLTDRTTPRPMNLRWG